jgi:nitroreductase
MSASLSPYLPTRSPRFSFERRRIVRASSPRVSGASTFPRPRRLGLRGVVVLASARKAEGHAGTRRAESTTEALGAIPSPGAPRSHLPLVTGIDYEPVPEGAIKLPAPDLLGKHHAPFEHVVSSRRSCREFADFQTAPPAPEVNESSRHAYLVPSGQVHLYELAQLCWATQGITAPEEPPDTFGHAAAARRAVASGGRLFPLTLFVAVRAGGVGGVLPGAYEYLPRSHALRKVEASTCSLRGERGAGDEAVESGETPSERDEDEDVFRREAESAHARLVASTTPQKTSLISQTWADFSPLLLVLVGDVRKTTKHGGLYETFGETLVTLEAGMAASSAQLQATALGLGATPIGAFDARASSEALFGETSHAPGEPKLMLAVGVPKGSFRETVGHVRWEDERDERDA